MIQSRYPRWPAPDKVRPAVDEEAQGGPPIAPQPAEAWSEPHDFTSWSEPASLWSRIAAFIRRLFHVRQL